MNDRNDGIAQLQQPKQFRLHSIHVLIIDPNLKFKAFNPIFIIAKVPANPQHLPTVDVLGHPEINNHEDKDQF